MKISGPNNGVEKEKFELTAMKTFYTLSVMIDFMGYGMGNNMVGSSLVDLAYIYGVDEEKMSNAPLMIAIGYVCGALLSGHVTHWYTNRQIIMACFLLPMALVNFVVLFMPYSIMLVLFFFYGSGFGACDSMLSVWIVELWPSHNNVILPLSVVLFGIGQVAAPTLMSPFVYGEQKPNSSVTVDDRVASLIIPYSVCGVFQIVIPILYVIFNFTSFRYAPPSNKNINDIDNQDEDENDPRIVNNPFRVYHLIIAGIAVAAYGGCEQGWGAFSSTMFQHLGTDFIDASEASLLLAYWSSAFSVGLILTTFVAMKLTPDKIILGQLLIIYISLALIFFGYKSKPFIYIGTIMFGYGMSPLWAMKFAFIEKHLKLTDRVASIYTVLFGCFAIMVPLILKETAKANPRMLVIIMFIFMIMSGLSFVAVKIWLVLLKSKRPIRDL